MRGNIGSELNGLYGEFTPDFVFITPAHPSNGRVVRDGIHYLHGKELNETEAAKDPVNESNITTIILQGSNRTKKAIFTRSIQKFQLF